MAKIAREEVLKLAKLAKIDVSEDEVEQFSREFTTILNYVEQLHKADVKNLKPTNQVTGLKNVMREDEIKEYGPTPAELLKNAPEAEKNQFKVKRVI